MRISDWSSDVCSSDLDELQQQLAFQCLAEGGDAARLDREAAGAADHVAQVEVDDRTGAPAGGGVGKTAVDGADRLVVDGGARVDGDAGGDRGVADGGRGPAAARMVARSAERRVRKRWGR